jgi:hypothetical protein
VSCNAKVNLTRDGPTKVNLTGCSSPVAKAKAKPRKHHRAKRHHRRHRTRHHHKRHHSRHRRRG